MNTETKTIEIEVVKDDALVQYASKTGLEPTATTSLVEAFRPIFVKARQALTDAAGVAESVKDATCVKEIKKSRACRLAIRAVRIESENTRKAQKEHAMRYGKAVDGFHNILLADLSPVETALQDAEDTAERAEAARLATLKAAREAELQPLIETPIMGDLSEVSEQQFAKMVSDAKLLRQAKLDAAKAAAEAAAKAEAEAKAKAESDRIERERIAAENARLKAEVEAREAAAKAEREAAERKLAAERAAAEAAAKAAAEKARKEREAIEAKAKAEREAVEAKAKAERAAAEAEAKKEQDRLKAIAEQHRKEHAAAVAREQAQRDAEAKRQAESAAAAKKAAAAPDNAKAQAFADMLRGLTLPAFHNSKAFAQLPAKVEALAKWIESQISTGELL